MNRWIWLLLLAWHVSAYGEQVERFKVLFHNALNYISPDDMKKGQTKSDFEKNALFEIWGEERPDILLLCEIGKEEQLTEIQREMKKRGVDLPFRDWVEGVDEVRHVALLSRFPVAGRQPHENLSYELNGRKVAVKRGFLEADLQVDDNYRIKIYVVHLKSKMQVRKGAYQGAGQSEMRAGEAELLREQIEEDMRQNPQVNLLVAGDLNDTPKSKPVRTLLGGGMKDLAPVDSKGYNGTYYDRRRERYERIDYIMASQGLWKEYVPDSGKLRDDKTAKIASDHFPIAAVFLAEEQ